MDGRVGGRVELALASHSNTFYLVALIGLGVLSSPPFGQPHKKEGPSACGARQAPGSGEPSGGVWEG